MEGSSNNLDMLQEENEQWVLNKVGTDLEGMEPVLNTCKTAAC